MFFPIRPKAAIRSVLQTLSILVPVLAAVSAEAAPKGKVGVSSRQPAASAASPSTKTSPLDTAGVRRYYLDGDFDPAIDLLETSLLYKTGFTHEDSVFIFKHLGVMYAAKYETREKGKKNMLRLLEVEPTARIMDMYASDMIYMIFKNIQDEFDASRRRLIKADTALGGGHGQSGKAPAEDNNDKPAKHGSAKGWWLVGGATVAAAGMATWYYFSDEPKVSRNNTEVE